ncbi:MAG TPA: hypothetical protein VFV51_04185 [Vicinamibacterales bacterium]|nr:hypothetical protein [Vicinamibacterales bacterium]
MNHKHVLLLAGVGLTCLAATLTVQAQEKPVVKIPNPGVPEVMTIEGNFVRAAYNREGYVILGYQLANRSLGEEWMLLEVGMTVLDNTPAYELKRDAMTLSTPDGKTIALATIQEHREGDTRALQQRERVQRDSINYFPPKASQACRLGFFAELDQRAMPWDQVELSNTRACLGRLYFKIPGGIQYGQHWLNVKFANSTIRVPFRIFTKEEERTMDKNYKDIRRQVQDAFRPPKKQD